MCDDDSTVRDFAFKIVVVSRGEVEEGKRDLTQSWLEIQIPLHKHTRGDVSCLSYRLTNKKKTGINR